MAKIRYIGKKDRKTDTIAGTGITWSGNGDVQEVPANAVQQLLAHTDSFELVGGKAASSVPQAAPASNQGESGIVETAGYTASTQGTENTGEGGKPGNTDEPGEQNNADHKPPLVNIESMDAQAMRDYAQKHFGHSFHHALKDEGKMRQTIIGLMNRG